MVNAAAGCLLGLDVGTTTVRAILFDLEGAALAEAACEPPVCHPHPDWAEIDVDVRWAAALDTMRRCVASAGVSPGAVQAIGLTGLMHALAPLDALGRPLARAMLWMDQRCRKQAAWMARERGETLAQALGRAAMSTTSSAPKLRWLREHEPELVDQTALFLPVQSLIGLRLTGVAATDPTQAGGTALYDRRADGWSPEMA
ncbi:MAG: xylulokinase, partial [Anaerolineae bacterium]|nr:xylulokinase [Anaerolineae bacterium]